MLLDLYCYEGPSCKYWDSALPLANTCTDALSTVHTHADTDRHRLLLI